MRKTITTCDNCGVELKGENHLSYIKDVDICSEDCLRSYVMKSIQRVTCTACAGQNKSTSGTCQVCHGSGWVIKGSLSNNTTGGG